ncbi:MAG: DUF3419 family protein [Cytophagales bacterium]|nr:MAG: DUF3419 family protein [Cytophagales bacterium]
MSVADDIYQKTSKHFKNILSQQNYLLHFILLGDFGELLPHYVRPENYEKIKKNIDKMTLLQGKVEEAIPIFGQFQYFNLSNIFEYMPDDIFIETAQKLAQGSENEAHLVYWNLMVPRSMSTILPQYFQNNTTINEKLSTQDKGFFYNQVVIDVKKSM